MMYKLIIFDQEENYIQDFLRIPKDLYTKSEIVQNEKEERALLLESHLLSKYFKIVKLLVYKGEQPCARCVLTFYPDDDYSCIGLFESINDIECTKILFEEAGRISIANQCVKIKGPIDASFWIKYRLKVNNFDKKAYVSEPYNKEYYLDLFLEAGYRVSEAYVSNYYKKSPLFNYADKKCKQRYKKFIDQGYKIISPKKKDYDRVISQIYKLIMELYKDFPVFKSVSEEDFVQQFGSYRHILDFSFVKIATYKQETIGFIIGMPDYGNMLFGKFNLIKYVKLFLKRMRSSNYVLLYMGVKPDHHGLGSAMLQTIIQNLQKKRSTSIGALIKKGKVTQRYVENKIISSNEYVLLECDL